MKQKARVQARNWYTTLELYSEHERRKVKAKDDQKNEAGCRSVAPLIQSEGATGGSIRCHLLVKYEHLDDNSKKKTEILKEITATMNQRLYQTSALISLENSFLDSAKAPSMDRISESHCGSVTQHGMKHMRAFANICNWGISMETMEGACISACGGYNSAKRSPLSHGYSA